MASGKQIDPSTGRYRRPQRAPAGGRRRNSDNPQAVVDAYLDALAAHDYDRARRWLSDGEFRYESPISTFSNADDFMLHMSLSASILQRVERVRVFTDGDEVCHFLDMIIQLSEKESVRVAQWSRVAGQRIVRIEVLFDAHRYRMMFEPPCADRRES